MSKTFWDLVDKSNIEIPEIQRDYAQGRTSERVTAIRIKFVKDILEAISQNKKLNLDFVFGQSVDPTNQANFNKSKQSLEQMLSVLKEYSENTGVSFTSTVAPKPVTKSDTNVLIPFDGQQRLTTLFLVHLYIAAKSGNSLEKLKKFSYKTRESSKAFIAQLTERYQIINEEHAEKLSDAIKDQSWFYTSWKKDPTVAGMLVMLDEIDEQVKEKPIDFGKAWHNLSNTNCIEFDFFDIQEEGFEEDLYVKMNARGKGLTDFENFRAWLEKKHKEDTELNDFDWVNQLDKEWLDLFWKTKDKVSDVDVNYLAFFKNLAVIHKISKEEKQEKEKVQKYVREREWLKILNPNVFTPTATYEKEKVFSTTSLRYIFTVLNKLTILQNTIDETVKKVWGEPFYKNDIKFTKLLLADFHDLSYYNKTFVVAVIRFIELYTLDDKSAFEKDLYNWLRVARNIIYNSRIDGELAYIPAVKALHQLKTEYVLNINTLANWNVEADKTWINFFNTAQQHEEVRKLKLINTNPELWQEVVIEAENHTYFYGQINFILEMAEEDPVLFKNYYHKVAKLFSKENLYSDQYIIQCTFFAFDTNDSWLTALTGDRFKFYKAVQGTSRDRDENWRQLFKDETKRKVLKELLDKTNATTEGMQQVINNKKQELKEDPTNWKFMMLDHPEMLAYCKEAIFTKTNDEYIRLLNKSLNSSRQAELRSYYFYKTHKPQIQNQYPPFTKFWYYHGERGNMRPCAILDEWQFKELVYYIDIYYNHDGIELRFAIRRGEAAMDPLIQSSLEEDHHFHFVEDYGLVLRGIAYKETDNKIAAVIETLNKINHSATAFNEDNVIA
ncbi:Protein of unknown function DUF262 [Pustulibacterium marinum]|uniref:GmrSD restriction endonucleases N-terminal domain-containing protein n=1 Tax=Pustulibacterium marinum TaxID=1224947 RepID=A0A1I7GXY6_9FLAO|nr:DUF262 domain-containing protein [Pustulibacterium marinum]SFU53324.1 Protein of unknown function DUF262 [Pustulibacterium marinum]